MGGNKVGADPDTLDDMAGQLAGAARALEHLAASLSAQLGSAPWRGPSADRFRFEWNQTYRNQMTAAASFLVDAESRLRRNATEQRGASAADGSASVGTFGSGPGSFGFGAPGSTALVASWLGLAAPWMLKTLEARDLVAGVPGLLRHGRVLEKAYAYRSALGLGGVPAAQWFKVAGGKIPFAGTALAVADVALNWRERGLYHEDTWKSMGMGGLGVGATVAAGPLGGLAFAAGATAGQFITDHTQVDEVLANAGWLFAFGDSAVSVGDPPNYQTASPAQIAEYSQRANDAAAEAARVTERATRPWLFGWDVGRGILRNL